MKSKKSGGFTTFLLILILLLGLSLLLYPSFSDWWNSFHQSRVIDTYMEVISHIDPNRYNEIWESAHAFNQKIRKNKQAFALSESMMEEYLQQLDVGDNGVMGYIRIPSIDVMLPVYHTVEDVVLQVAVGHIEWSSLPIGGESTHSILSGHRGLPSAKLFSDLDKLREGDVFILQILDQTFTYEVDQILIVLPDVIDGLLIEEGKDLCTLVTCTPYGVNSHRLLVRGHRVENAAQASNVRVTADALRIQPLVVAAVLFFPFLLLILLVVSLFEKDNKRKS